MRKDEFHEAATDFSAGKDRILIYIYMVHILYGHSSHCSKLPKVLILSYSKHGFCVFDAMISLDLQECRVLHMKQDGPKVWWADSMRSVKSP